MFFPAANFFLTAGHENFLVPGRGLGWGHRHGRGFAKAPVWDAAMFVKISGFSDPIPRPKNRLFGHETGPGASSRAETLGIRSRAPQDPFPTPVGLPRVENFDFPGFPGRKKKCFRAPVRESLSLSTSIDLGH